MAGWHREVYLDAIGTVLRIMDATGRAIPKPVPSFHYDIETHEYDPPATVINHAVESTRGLGRSFGYNAMETAADLVKTAKDLVHLLIDVVSKGGNLLINVGPDGHGPFPDLQRQPLDGLGAWLDRHGEAIFGTHPWSAFATTTADGQAVRFTQKDDRLFLIVLAETLGDELVVHDLVPETGSHVGFLGGTTPLPWRQDGTDVRICRSSPSPELAHVITIDPPDTGG